MQSCQGLVMAAVWGLTAAAVLQVFQKCGMVKEDDEGRKRVKIYRDKEGRQKGDGLVTYLKEPSVSCDVHEASGGWTPGVQRPDADSKCGAWLCSSGNKLSTCLQQPACPDVACQHGQLSGKLCFASSSAPGQVGMPAQHSLGLLYKALSEPPGQQNECSCCRPRCAASCQMRGAHLGTASERSSCHKAFALRHRALYSAD